MRKRAATYLSILTLLTFNALADEGMWIPSAISDSVFLKMKKAGLELTRGDIYNPDSVSLTDAVVQVGKGCSGGFISADGLLITNYHCVRYYIQQHSTVAHNLFDKGFKASSGKEELKCDGLTVELQKEIVDVSDSVLAGVDSTMSIRARDSIIKKNKTRVIAGRNSLPAGYKARVETFFFGKKYYLFVYQELLDVRMVFCPPESLADFGKDKDNWQWPRHNADFAILRVYADSANNPKPYSATNKPFVPRKHFTINVSPKKEKDFTLVLGFPGATEEYLTKSALTDYRDVILPTRLDLMKKRIDAMKEQMDVSPETNLNYTTKYLRNTNFFFKSKSDFKALSDTGLYHHKEQYYSSIPAHLNSVLDSLYNVYYELQNTSSYYYWSVLSIDIVKLAVKFQGILKAGENASTKDVSKCLEAARAFYKTINVNIDRNFYNKIISDICCKHTSLKVLYTRLAGMKQPKLLSKAMREYDNSFFSDSTRMYALLAQSPGKVVKQLKGDYIYLIASETFEMAGRIEKDVQREKDLIDSIQRINYDILEKSHYTLYPDANSTYRVSYGQIGSYEPRDAVYYNFQTFLDGTITKYLTSDPNYVLDTNFVAYLSRQPEGRKMPTCFISNCHTTGGNSGSPVVDARGRLIGVNFDRNIEGAVNDYIYNVNTTRNIVVDARYILFLLEDYYKDTYVLQSLNISYD